MTPIRFAAARFSNRGPIARSSVTSASPPVENAQILAESDEPVPRPGAERMALTSGITDSDGRFRITGLAAGRLRLTGRGRGLTAVPITIALGAGDTKEVRVAMSATAVLRGRVVLDGKPIGGAKIRIVGGASDDAVSQDDGSFVLDRAPLGDVTFAAPPYNVRSPKTLRLTSSNDQPVTLEVEPMGVVSGTVRRHGEPVPGARIMIGTSAKTQFHAAYADDAGRFSLQGVEPGEYWVFADAAVVGASVDDIHFSLEAGEHRSLDVDLVSGGHISGVVVDPHGAPVPSVFVAFGCAASGDSSNCMTDSSGHFDCASMNGGGAYEAAVYATAEGTSPLPFVGLKPGAIALANGNASTAGIRLVIEASTQTIRGIVVDSSGTVVVDARVSVATRDVFVPAPTTATNVDGRFEIGDLAPGAYSLQVDGDNGAKALASQIATGTSDLRIVLDPPKCGDGEADPARASILHAVPADLPYRPSGRVVWDDRIELVGWNIPPSAHLGEKFDAVVYYRVLQPVERSWKAFVHIDLDGESRANADHDPIGGHCPTSTWQVGDILVDRFTTSVTTNSFGGEPLGPGDYSVWIGFFTGYAGEWTNMPLSQAPPDVRDDKWNRVRIAIMHVE